MYGLSLHDAGVVSMAISRAKQIDFRMALTLSGLFEHADNLSRYNITYIIDNKYELVRQIHGAHSKTMTLEIYSLSADKDGNITRNLLSNACAPYSDCITETDNSNSDYWRTSCLEQECIKRLSQLYPDVARHSYAGMPRKNTAFLDAFKKMFGKTR